VGRELNVHADIDGVALTALTEIGDERGAVLHMMRADAPDFAGFGECYFSEIRPGARKAWKRHRTHTQNLAVPVGRIRVVIYDGRAYSPTVGQVAAIELGRPDAYQRLRIPPLLWYGFKCLSHTSALIANCCDRVHDPSESESLPFEQLDSSAAIRLLS
jgi:dTDP-4-dehydrorhamnose 3,5-epimerase